MTLQICHSAKSLIVHLRNSVDVSDHYWILHSLNLTKSSFPEYWVHRQYRSIFHPLLCLYRD